MDSMDNEKKMTIREAAKALGVSMATIRRRIKAGEIPAEIEEGPYGPTYYIKESDLAEAASVIEVVPLTRELDANQIHAIFTSIMQPLIDELLDEIAKQRRIIEQQNEKIEQLTEQLREKEERDRLLMKAIRDIQEQKKEEKKPWWKKLFGR